MSVDPVAHNRVAWDRQVDQGNEWSRPISADTVRTVTENCRTLRFESYEFEES